jgi:hypothetical protein
MAKAKNKKSGPRKAVTKVKMGLSPRKRREIRNKYFEKIKGEVDPARRNDLRRELRDKLKATV